MNKDLEEPIFPESKQIFRGDGRTRPFTGSDLPQRPPWRAMGAAGGLHRGTTYQANAREIDMVNAALYLRRPLLITGPPGVGKSSLAYAVAHELELGEVLVWPITSRSTREQGLYSYDAVARFQDIALAAKQREALAAGVRAENATQTAEKTVAEADPVLPDIGRYIRLGPLGTAFLRSQLLQFSVVLIDELDKSDIDLPNDLLHLFEEGAFDIPEIARLPDDQFPSGEVLVRAHDGDVLPVSKEGRIRCKEFPLVIVTNNGEREFPPAFLRRCLRLEIPKPTRSKLRSIVKEHLEINIPEQAEGADQAEHRALGLLDQFLALRDGKEGKMVATDQLLNAVYLLTQGIDVSSAAAERLRQDILAALAET